MLDEMTMNMILRRCGESSAGVILRLAWQAGLKRHEIRSLTWGQVDLMEWKIRLPGRMASIPMELAVFLAPLAGAPEIPVVASQRTGEMLEAQTISHLARKALAEGGLADVQLTDLRNDCAERRLAAGEPWQEVSRSLGMSAAALRALGVASTRAAGEPRAKAAAVERLIEKEGATPAGIAIALAWRQELGLEEILSLKWEQVGQGVITLPERTVPLDVKTQKLLEGLRRETGWVLSTRTLRPYDRARLSRLAREVFVAHGLDDLTLRGLRQLRLIDEGDVGILSLAGGRQGVSARELQEELSLSDTALRRRLRRLTEQGKLLRVGFRYYLPGAVVPPEAQEEAVLSYIKEEGFAYRQDIARLLRIAPAQCRPVLQRLVEAGKLRLEEQRYLLAADNITE